MVSLGQMAENMVADHYCKDGFAIVARNFIFPKGKQVGELDLVVTKDQELVFVEVKARRTNRFGTGLEAVDSYKQRKLVKTSKLFIKMHPEYELFNVRIDVAEVDVDNIANPVIILVNAIDDSD